MPRIKGHPEIRAAAFLVSRINSRVQALLKCVLIAATRCPPAEPKHSNLVRIDVPLRGVKAHQPHRPLRIFQRHRRFGYGPDLGNGPSPGTRYFNSTQVIPLDVSQSQTSVPSRSMARIQ